MYCPKCTHPNPADAQTCVHCQQDTSYLRERLFIGQQFLFVQADNEHPLSLKVNDTVQTYQTATILSRHQYAVSFGDELAEEGKQRQPWRFFARQHQVWPLPDLPQLPGPSLKLLTVVTDRKIYRPDTEATLFIVAPDAG
ncbi:MAG: hypothetical protein MN733_40320, partial [Nitrososphaera sp.]|nr:hypothetical protein [Nitrososphaera sp.]